MKVHFIGIGGIGISALAQYYLKRGWEVSGSDLEESEITELLEKKGAKVFIGNHKSENLKISLPAGRQEISKPKLKMQSNQYPDLVIFTSAIQSDNPELKMARRLGIKCQTYPEALGALTKEYWTIAVAGTHGKSTTTAMVANILVKAGFDPTVILGTKLKEFGNSNFRPGLATKKPKYLVVEADEYRAAFLNYWPKMIVLTTIEKEHIDYYKDLKHILKTYKKFISNLPPGGRLIVNGDDRNIQKVNSKFKIQNSKLQIKIKKYSLRQKEAGMLRSILKIPGEHNVSNALAALTAARLLGIPDKIVLKALGDYKGAWRRFEEKWGKISGKKIKIISDYGHHPTEIAVTLTAARQKYPNSEIWAIFQPHQYKRTYYLFDDFIKTFREAPVDRFIVTDVYSVAGREKNTIKKKVNIAAMVKKTGKSSVIYLPFPKIPPYLKTGIARRKRAKPILIIMGAGDIYRLVDYLS